jgi:hypothetical protein
MEFLLPLLQAGPDSSCTIHALRAIQGVCEDNYMNQNTARSAGLLDETMRLLKLGRGWEEMVGAAAGAVASMCKGGNQSNIRAFRWQLFFLLFFSLPLSISIYIGLTFCLTGI